MTEDADIALPGAVKTGHERYEGGLAGPVRAEQDHEGAWLHGEVHVRESFALSETMGEAFDDKSGHGATTSPQGERPTPMVFTTSRFSRSITETSLELPFAV